MRIQYFSTYNAFQLTAARRRLDRHRRRGQRFSVRFNSQPPEGGWSFIISSLIWYVPFQLTAARRRLVYAGFSNAAGHDVSTHSRPKAAGPKRLRRRSGGMVSTHSRPKAAGGSDSELGGSDSVSTHSRPKAAGANAWPAYSDQIVSTHSRPKAAGYITHLLTQMLVWFQLTAARRRLVGGLFTPISKTVFQLTAARRRLVPQHTLGGAFLAFQLTAARRRLDHWP